MRTILLFPKQIFFLFLLTFLVFNTVNAQTLSKKQQDSLYLFNPGKERILKIKNHLQRPLSILQTIIYPYLGLWFYQNKISMIMGLQRQLITYIIT